MREDFAIWGFDVRVLFLSFFITVISSLIFHPPERAALLSSPLLRRSANAEYIRMADVIVDVPGGSNNHNYANVTLIVELARLHGVHAVWAGWGHASEKPALPNALASSDPPIAFVGPSGPPMRALGDKIGSTIIAKNAGVPCISWNGARVVAEYDRERGTLPEEALAAACVACAADASDAAAEIGFPVMIKASEGGGGRAYGWFPTGGTCRTRTGRCAARCRDRPSSS